MVLIFFADDSGVILIDLNKINTSVEPKIISEDNSYPYSSIQTRLMAVLKFNII